MFFFSQHTNELFLGELFFDVPLAVWSISGLLLTYQGISSAYLCAIWVAFPLLTKLMTYKELKEKGMATRLIPISSGKAGVGIFIAETIFLWPLRADVVNGDDNVMSSVWYFQPLLEHLWHLFCS